MRAFTHARSGGSSYTEAVACACSALTGRGAGGIINHSKGAGAKRAARHKKEIRVQNYFNAKWAVHAGIALAAVGAFAGGMHLRPGQAAGHDLYRAQVAQNPPAETGTGGGLTLTQFDGQKPPARTGQALLSPQTVRVQDDTDEASPASTFQDVYTLLHRNYVEGVSSDSKLSHGAASAMLSSLQDPASRFLEPDEFAEAKREMQGQFAGIGAATDVRLTQTPKTADDITRDKEHPTNLVYSLVLVSVLPGGPADKAGLKNGDVVTDINGQWVASYDLVAAQAKQLKAAQDKNDPVALNKIVDALQKKLDNGLTLAQAQSKLRDPKAKPLILAVTRAGTAKPLSVSVTPLSSIAAPPVTGRMLASGDGYIQVGLLDANTASEFAATLSGLGASVKGLVLDLRGTSGGTPEEAAAIASKVSTITSLGLHLGRGLQTTPIAVRPARAISGPLVVLVDGGTEGPAELLAAALKAGGAKLIGTTTFGDDKDVRTVGLPDGSGFTMTVGQMLTTGGGHFGGIGIAPDVSAPQAGAGDPTLDRAIATLSGRVARAFPAPL